MELLPQFWDTLRQAMKCDFAANDRGWLTDTNTRFLFLLDGFDELVLSQREGQGLKVFLENVSKFQRECADRPQEQGHRVLITGRPMALQGHEFELPKNLSRVGIVPMADELQERWMANWQAYTGEENTQKLRSLIRAEHWSQELQDLAREPLLLYLLAVLARSDKLNPQVFDQKQGIAVKIEIYSTLIDFVLEQQRTDAESGKNITEILTGLKPKQLRGVLGELALCITQTGTEGTSVDALKQRMPEKTEKIDDLAKHNILAAFYLKKESQSGSIEFIHKSFREFLTAERLQQTLAKWTEVRQDEYDEEEEVVSHPQLEWQIYDVLGYGILTQEILDYLMGLLQQRPDFSWGKLAQRLQKFYFRWAKGEFIEQPTETLPQRKAGQLQKQGIDRGQRQVDIYTGLNAMLLLFALHRYGQTLPEDALKAQLSFHPCGLEGTDNWDNAQLLRLISYSDCLRTSSFTNLLGRHLSRADLSNADLSRADLSRADLSRADLRRADLRNVNLSSAYLRRANLSSADLRSADLRNANLRNADLSNADLSSAYLISADLSNADLRNADLRRTDLSRANLRSAYLISTDLRRADLRRAYLISADLRRADLSRADLRRANLRRADLRRTDLRRADLISADLAQANLGEVQWNPETRWDNSYNLHTALNLAEELNHHPPFAAALRLSEGVALAQRGEIDTAVQLYAAAQQHNPNLVVDAPHWQYLCWYGCLHHHAEQVLFAGEKAVQLPGDEPEISCLETRGIARAITHDLAGALADLQAAQKSDRHFYTVISRQSRSNEQAKAQRDRWIANLQKGEEWGWIANLQKGENPFTPEELAALRQD